MWLWGTILILSSWKVLAGYHWFLSHGKNLHIEGWLISFIWKAWKYPTNQSCRKRQNIENYKQSKTFNTLTGLIGRGGLGISAACDLASSIVGDHSQNAHEAIKAFSSLGTEGKHPQNQERDLYRWLRNLYGLRLQTYTVELQLQVPLHLLWQSLCFLF